MANVKLHSVNFFTKVYPQRGDNWGAEVQRFDINNPEDLRAQLPRHVLSERLVNITSWELEARDKVAYKATFWDADGNVYLRDIHGNERINIEPQAEYIGD